MKIPRIKLKKIKDFLKKTPKVLGEKAFLTFLGLLLIALLFGFLIFYQYNILAQRTEPVISEKPLQFKEKTFQEVLKIWQEKEKRFDQAQLKEYPNPFSVD